MTRVLVAGLSTRAAAESAARAGYDVTAIDAFADLDQHPSVRALSLPRDFGAAPTADAAARAARGIGCDAVAYLSSFENHPRAVARLSSGRALWGNAPAVLRHVRDPFALAAALHEREVEVPALRPRGDAGGQPGDWIVKPRRSGGGRRVRLWDGGTISAGSYLQQRIEGVAASVVFVAAGRTVVPLGVSRQLIGDPAFGASGFGYCGSVLAAPGDAQFTPALVARARALARVVGDQFHLVGVNGVDFIARGDVPYPIEVNPRWTASMELVERHCGLSVFAAHADACRSGALPAFDPDAAARHIGAVGKAIVFARQPVTMGDTRAWLGDGTVRDVPVPGERIAAGQPICTIFASAPDSGRCYAALVARADALYASLGRSPRT